MNGNQLNTIEVLLAEDDPSDVRVIKNGLQATNETKVNVNVVSNGEEAMQFLHKEWNFKNAPLPHLIILDLNMPRKDGREVLHDVKADEKLNHIPVVVLTTSSAKGDVMKSYKLQCSSFITKPGELTEFKRAIEGIKQFWSKIATPPAALNDRGTKAI